jgi:tetratricopeptide (TPR) repeat protein
MYRDELPDFIGGAIDECSNHWKRGDATQAIHWAEQAQARARASGRYVSECVACIWLADLYLEATRLALVEEYCEGAISALRLQPNYKHRYHIEAVIYYLRGLLLHALGFNAKALADYQWALASFEKAKDRWAVLAGNPTQADMCEKAIRWINALCRCLASELAPVTDGTVMYVTVIDKQDYALTRLELVGHLLPLEVTIRDQQYRMHDPGNGVGLEVNLAVRWNAHYFVLYVPEDEWAGPFSTQEDYILVRRERPMAQLEGPGVVWDGSKEQWEYGAFTRDPETGEIWFHPLSPIVIGGAPQDEEARDGEVEDEGPQGEEVEGKEVADQLTGVVRALLKPV